VVPKLASFRAVWSLSDDGAISEKAAQMIPHSAKEAFVRGVSIHAIAMRSHLGAFSSKRFFVLLWRANRELQDSFSVLLFFSPLGE
jgi:PIN domain nuclease of toxin-antitoxin system